MSPNLQNYNKIKDIIQRVSVNRKYQKWLMCYFLIFAFSMHFTGSVTMYLFNNPVFQCPHSTKLVQEKQACKRLDQCSIHNKDLLTAHLHLYCGDNSKSRNLIRSMKGTGEWIGIISIGIATDTLGKKNCMKIGLLCANLWFVEGLFLGSYLDNHFILGFAYLSYGLGLIAYQQISYVHITRFLQKKSYEQLTVLLFFTGSGVSLTLFGLITSFVKNWIVLVLIASIPLITLLVMSFILREDPYFLLLAGKLEECQEIIRYIGKVNEANDLLIEEQVQLLASIQFTFYETDQQLFSCGSIANNLKIWKLVVVLGLVYVGNHISEGSFNFTVQQIGYSYEGNLIIMGLAALTSTSTFLYVLECQSQRKRGYIITTIVQLLLSCLYLTAFISASQTFQIILLFVIKFLSTWTTNFYTRLQVDCLPKSYQVTLIGIILLIGKVAVIVEPQIIQYESDHHICAIVMNNAVKVLFGVGSLLLITERYYEINQQKTKDFTQIQQNQIEQIH